MDVKKIKQEVEDLICGGVKAAEELNKKGNITATDVKVGTDILCMLNKGFETLSKIDEYGFLDEEYDEYRYMNKSSGRHSRNGMTGRFTSRHSISDRMVEKLEELYDEEGPHNQQVISDMIKKIRMSELM